MDVALRASQTIFFSFPLLGLMGVAQLASHWNLPVFSWVSDLLDSVDEHKYTTLVRLSGSFSSICKFLTCLIMTLIPVNI